MRDSSNLEYVPVIIPEGGTEPSYEECSNYTQHVVDKMTLPFTGIAGFNAWGGDAPVYQASASSPVTLPSYIHDKWKTTIRTKNHMNGVDVINTLSNTWGAWKQGMGKGRHKDSNQVEAVEMQAYISSNKELVVGYVRNRTFNVYTQGINGSKCKDIEYDDDGDVKDYSPINKELNILWDKIKNSEQLKVEDLKKRENYIIDFYGDDNGSHLSQKTVKTSFLKSLTLPYPELWVVEPWQNRPVVWFVAKREGYSGKIQNNDMQEDSLAVLSNILFEMHNDSLSQKYSLNVHPNPFDNFINIESLVDDEILIQDPSGRITLKQKISKGKNRIRTERLTNGIYFIHFNKQSQNFKIIKQ